MEIKAIIFDLDGVIVSTDDCHYEAWKHAATDENIYFDHEINKRLRGVSRMESLDIILEKSNRPYSLSEKLQIAERKNEYYKELINNLTPQNILPGVSELLSNLRARNIKLAIGSSSKNSPIILKYIGLDKYFDATADGNEIQKSKPDPEVFLLAAKKLGVEPSECLVIEDADAGVEAALAGGMKVLAIGAAAGNRKANILAINLEAISIDTIISV